MSTSYGYLCVTDGSVSPCDLNHLDHVLRDLASVRVQLAEVMKADRHGYFEFHIMGYGYCSVVEWLMEHAHHVLALRDEYGRLEELDGVVEST